MSKNRSRQSSGIDPRLRDAYLTNLDSARNVAANLGPRQFAGFTPDWHSGAQGLRNNAFAGMDAVQQGMGTAGSVAGYTPQTIPGMDRAAYMNPFMDEVANRTMLDMDRQRQMMMGGIGDQAAAAGAFGGSRHGVAEAETNRGFGDLFANQMAAMRMAGFDNASGLMQADANRALQGQELNLAAAGLLGGLGAQQQQMGLTGADALMNLGMTQQQFTQAQLDAIRELPLEQQAILNEALGIYPSITQQSGRSSGWDLSGVAQAAGMAYAASDRRLKENVALAGSDPNTGLRLYDFNYIGDTVRYRGVMADEVEPRFPEAVSTRADGFKQVDYRMLGIEMQRVSP